MRSRVIIGALALLAGCGPVTNSSAPAPSVAASAAPCADGGVRLEGAGLCQSEAVALLTHDPEVRVPELPAGCDWVVNETMPPGDEAILYFAASCGGVVTKLGFAGGARSAEIAYERSAVFGDAAVGRVVIRLFGTDPDPQGAQSSHSGSSRHGTSDVRDPARWLRGLADRRAHHCAQRASARSVAAEHADRRLRTHGYR